MIINKNNQQIIGVDSLSVNDLLINSFEFIVKEKKIIKKISNYRNDDKKHVITFENVFKLEF